MDISLAVLMALSSGTLPSASPSAAICAAATGDDARIVAWLRGDYGVLGSRSGQPYTGQLTLSGDEDSEVLGVSGIVHGLPRKGAARYVRCGPDQVRQLQISFEPGQMLYCVPHHDYDNLNRASCTRSLSDPDGDQELWFQRRAP